MPDYEPRIHEAINSPDLLPEQRKLLLEYDSDAVFNTGETPRTRVNRLGVLTRLGKAVRKPYLDMTADDIRTFIYSLKVAPSSLNTYKSVIKKFYKWLYKGDEYPECVKWLKISTMKKRKLPEDILTVDEVKRIIDAADNPRDQAMVAIFYDTGARLGEILSLNQKNVITDEYGLYIVVTGKTGMRRIRLTVSIPYVKQLLNTHPRKGDNSPLFTTQCKPRMSEPHCQQTLKRLADKAGIKKNVHPHIFRHSRMTHLAGDLTEQQLKIYAGWTGDSRMAGTYVHLSGADVDNRILELAGMKSPDESREKNEALKPITCSRCEEVNAATNVLCVRCGLPLTEEGIRKAEKRESEFEEIKAQLDEMKKLQTVIGLIMENPDMQKKLAEKMK